MQRELLTDQALYNAGLGPASTVAMHPPSFLSANDIHRYMGKHKSVVGEGLQGRPRRRSPMLPTMCQHWTTDSNHMLTLARNGWIMATVVAERDAARERLQAIFDKEKEMEEREKKLEEENFHLRIELESARANLESANNDLDSVHSELGAMRSELASIQADKELAE
ncbi:hypothetical protein COCNU_06G017960 [Cocos nucifera]|uniref:Uncharacterized protein n=1 Tax=Cocos nucifera TaxID=13894 RepID=A0A8K0IDM6_COCNU|nr:hypothetical protein COCNU_06G017960 [Cocos nucifera]